MRKRRVRPARGVWFDILETRRFFSAVLQPLALPDANVISSQVQPPAIDQPTYHVLPSADGLTPLLTAGPTGYSPNEVRTAYGLNQISFNGTPGDGTGQTIAIIDAYNDPTIRNDLHAFDQAFGLSDPNLRVVSQTGGSALPSVDPAGAGHSNWEGEEALDVEWAHALAPGVDIILVEAKDSSPSNLFAAVDWARRQTGVSVVSMSFGGNETLSETSYDSVFTTPAGHNGVTFVASTGDAGAPAGYPALSPNVVATGGTSLALDGVGNYQSETGWSGSGGGPSTVEARPSYQSGVVKFAGSFRTNPDVAFVADPSTGVAVYDSYDNGTTKPWEVLGGTSVAAPCWAGIFAVANQGRIAAGAGTLDSRSQTLPLLYSAPVSDFHDVTTGNNGYAVASGYDLITGRGSPKANLLIPYLASASTAPPQTTVPTIAALTADAGSVAQGTPVTLSAQGVSDPNGTGLVVTFYEETNGVPGLQTDPKTGDFAFSPVTDGSNALILDTTGATPGDYTFYAQLSDASGATSPSGNSAPSVSITVTAPSASGPSIASVTSDANPVNSGDLFTLSANGVTDNQASIRRVYFYEETNGIPGLQAGPGGDFAFRPTTAASGYSLQLDSSGVTGSFTFYALATDTLGNVSSTGADAPSATVDIVQTSPPAAPTGLTAAAVSPSEIDLAFSEADSGQTGFTIQRSRDPSFTHYTRLFTINRPDLSTYSDTGLSPHKHYYYRVEAFNGAGGGGFSNAADATTFRFPTHLVLLQKPAGTTAGQRLGAVAFAVEDATDHLVTTDDSSVTLTLAKAPSGASLGGTLTAPVVNGVATFGDLLLTQAGSYRLLASDGALKAAHSNRFTITPDAASARLVLVQQASDGLVERRLNPALWVDVQDQYGNIVRRDWSLVTLSIDTGPDGGQLLGRTSKHAHRGVVSFASLRFSKPGTYKLTVLDESLADPTPASWTVAIA